MTTHCQHYNSLFLDPHTSGVDALRQTDWQVHNNFMNAPFRLLNKVINTVCAQKAQATIIAPMVASTDVVPKTETIVSVSPNQTSKSQIHLLSPTMSHTRTCEQSTLETVCLESEWESRLRHKNWSTECTQLYKFFLADSSLKQYNRYILQFKEFCLKQGYSFPPPFHDVSALISSFMELKSDLSERPESMLRSIQGLLLTSLQLLGIQTHLMLTVRTL